jgi:RNA polymerase sigma-70 factor (ECF subfamily)
LEDQKKIIKGCIAGKIRAQEELYKQFAPKMFGVCLRYAKDTTEAEDNLQEGFIKVFQNIDKFRSEGSLEGWIRRIMVNVSLEKYRKQHQIYPVEDISIYEESSFSDDILARIATQDLIELIQKLPTRYRMVFNLYAIEGLNHNEISDEMGITVGTSKSNLSRARDILKRKVEKLYSEVKTNNYTA